MSAAAESIAVGTVLADTYEVTRLLGKGGMGAVWEAKHLRLQDKRVAIKVLHSDVARDAESVIRFKREANIASQLGHANIVQVFDIKELPDGSQYIVLEYLEGEDLSERLARGIMTLEQTMAIARQVGSALQAAHHHSIVHRDLKPGNIMLVPTEFGGYATEQAKVLDFGISKMQDSSTLKTQTATVLGTPQYMAPEQALGEHNKVDARTDIFAFGCIVYEMLAGTMAFQGTTIPEVMFKIVYQEPTPLRELAPQVPEPVASAVHRAMAKNQDERFADMSAFVEALTGDPLTTLRSGAATAALPSKPQPPSMAASRAARARSEEAFASTMGPAAGPAAGMGPTAGGLDNTAAGAAPAWQPAAGMANTAAAGMANTAGAGMMYPATAAPDMMGTAGAGVSGNSAMPAVPAMTGPGTMAAAPRERRSLVPIIAVIALAVVAAVAVTMLVMKSSGQDTKSNTPQGLAANTTDTPAGADAGATGAGGSDEAQDTGTDTDTGTDADTGTDTGTGKDTDTGKDSGKDTGKDSAKDTGKDSGKDTGKDSAKDTAKDTAKDSAKDSGKDTGKDKDTAALPAEALAKLARAQEQFKSKNYQEAIDLARASLGIKSSNRAWSIITRSYCAKRDLSNAKANARRLGKRERRRVARFCDGFDVDIR